MEQLSSELASRICLFPGSDSPLSSETVLFEGDRFNWVFDPGRLPQTAEQLLSGQKPLQIVFSHFHGDHTDNISLLSYETLFLGKYTGRHFQGGTVITDSTEFSDGCSLLIHPFPSSHAKGCLALEINHEILLVGDGIYPTTPKTGLGLYNANTLTETLRFLEQSPVHLLGISHRKHFWVSKTAAVSYLSRTAENRGKHDSFLVSNAWI